MNTANVLDKLLGKRAPILDPRTFQLSKYLRADAPVPPLPPKRVNYLQMVKDGWPMYFNDRLGTCGPATVGHAIEIWTNAATGTTVVPSEDDILQVYKDVGGYVPGNPATDNGVFMLDLLKYWRVPGVAGHQILSFAAVDWRNKVQMRQAIAWFGDLLLGLALPISAQHPDSGHQFPRWNVPAGGPFGKGSPGTWGGHMVPCGQYSAQPLGFAGVEIVTWGQIYEASWDFLYEYCDECYVALSQDWLDAMGKSPPGFDLEQLVADLNAL